MEVRVTTSAGMKALAQVDLGPGDMAMLSGGALYVYGPLEAHRCDPDGCDHASDCAVHNEPAYRAGPCDCGAPE
jgi:hypothetical protein